jgi:ubiquinone/menaquinone biosynthesis C-methylase UbiE
MTGLVLDQLAVSAGDRVLDVGFGGGRLLERLLPSPAEQLLGVDISPEMVARGQKHFRADKRVSISLASADKLPFETGSVTRLCSVHTVYFWDDPLAVLKEFARVLAPGGRLVLGLEAPETLRAWPGHRFGFRVYDAEEVSDLVRDAGFHDTRVVRGTEPGVGELFCVVAGKR